MEKSKYNQLTKTEVARALDFLMKSQSDDTAIFIDKNTIDIDYGVLSEDVPTECHNGTDFCDLLQKEKGFKFADESVGKNNQILECKIILTLKND
jgi:hypothetical protein